MEDKLFLRGSLPKIESLFEEVVPVEVVPCWAPGVGAPRKRPGTHGPRGYLNSFVYRQGLRGIVNSHKWAYGTVFKTFKLSLSKCTLLSVLLNFKEIVKTTNMSCLYHSSSVVVFVE